jgi:curved DNA-binding protein CbpA
METKETAFKILNVPETADRSDIKQAYRRLVRRYPPEFHSEKFRRIDDAYHLLTSLSFLLDHFLNPPEADLFAFDPSPPENLMKEALGELRRLFVENHLRSPLQPPGT